MGTTASFAFLYGRRVVSFCFSSSNRGQSQVWSPYIPTHGKHVARNGWGESFCIKLWSGPYKQKNEPTCLMLLSLAHKQRHKKNMFVFPVLMLVRLCLRLCARENSILKTSAFVLMFLLTLTARVFSLVKLLSWLCASENQPLFKVAYYSFDGV